MRDCNECAGFCSGAKLHAERYDKAKKSFLEQVKLRSTKDAKQYKPGSDYYKEMDMMQRNVDDLVRKFGTVKCPNKLADGSCPNRAETSAIRGRMISAV